MEIEQIYKNVDNILIEHIMLNDDAMKYMQSYGFNGFKRLHRYLEKELVCLHQQLENCFYDKYQKVLTTTNLSTSSYQPLDLKSHLEKWGNQLNRAIQELGELNQAHFDAVGITNNIIEDTICIFLKKHEKVSRWIKRFNESNWNSLDCHIVDDRLHEKMKKKEEGD